MSSFDLLENSKIICEIIGLGIMKVTIWLQKCFRPIVIMPSWCSFKSDENCIQFERCKSLYNLSKTNKVHTMPISFILFWLWFSKEMVALKFLWNYKAINQTPTVNSIVIKLVVNVECLSTYGVLQFHRIFTNYLSSTSQEFSWYRKSSLFHRWLMLSLENCGAILLNFDLKDEKCSLIN